MSVETQLLFFQWCTGILVFAALTWTVAFGVLAFRDRPRYRRPLQ